jgi:hypothetical protein
MMNTSCWLLYKSAAKPNILLLSLCVLLSWFLNSMCTCCARILWSQKPKIAVPPSLWIHFSLEISPKKKTHLALTDCNLMQGIVSLKTLPSLICSTEMRICGDRLNLFEPRFQVVALSLAIPWIEALSVCFLFRKQ